MGITLHGHAGCPHVSRLRHGRTQPRSSAFTPHRCQVPVRLTHLGVWLQQAKLSHPETAKRLPSKVPGALLGVRCLQPMRDKILSKPPRNLVRKVDIDVLDNLFTPTHLLIALPVLFAYLLASLAIYVLPTIIAVYRQHDSRVPIILVDILLGWTAIGWVVALVWSFTPPVPVPRSQSIS